MKNLLSFTALIAIILYSSLSFGGYNSLTIAGGGTNTPAVGLNATDVEIGEIYSSKVDINGNLYIANYPHTSSSLWVIRVDKWGMIDRLYENATTPVWYFDDIITDSGGNIYLPAYDESVIYKIALDGTQTVVASGLDRPESISIDSDDNIYFSEMGPSPNVIKKIDKQGTITLIFDGSEIGYGMIDTIYSDGLGNIYFTSSNAVWKVTGQSTAAQIGSSTLSAIYGMTGDKYGNLYFGYRYYDTGTGIHHHVLKVIDKFGTESTLFDNNVTYSAAYPARFSTDNDGTLYINYYNNPSGSHVDKITFDPEIKNILPLDAAAGERVTISGRYFGSNGIGGTATFGGISAPIHSWSNEMIVCDIPAGISKTVDVVVTAADGQISNFFSYRIR